MIRRSLILASLSAGLLVAAHGFTRGSAQEATPVPDPGLMTIRWELQRIASGNRVLTPDDPTAYWFQLLPDGRVAIQADCNQAGGTYTIDGSSLSFPDLVTTDVACEGESISDEFVRNLGDVVSFTRTSEASDQLVLSLMADGGQLTFEPALTGVVWEWTGFEGGDGSFVAAADPGSYTIEFFAGGDVQVRADCNSGSGKAAIDEPGIDFSIATTLMGCPEGSQGTEFLRYLDEAVSYVIRDGQLALSLPMDAGIAFFRPAIPAAAPATPAAGATR